eukprot:366490-Chlamydomonas_euryale.AAC.13
MHTASVRKSLSSLAQRFDTRRPAMCATVRAAASPNWISATGPQPFGSERTSRKLPRCRLGALAACRAALYQPADADVAYVVQDPHARFSTSQKRWGRRCLALAAACSPRPTALHTYRMSGRLRRMRGPAAAKGACRPPKQSQQAVTLNPTEGRSSYVL